MTFKGILCFFACDLGIKFFAAMFETICGECFKFDEIKAAHQTTGLVCLVMTIFLMNMMGWWTL